MTKTPSIKTLKIILFFTLLLGLFIALYTFLHRGIKIEHFAFANSQIEGFYLRLDKKLIVEIQSLRLKHLEADDNLPISTQIRLAKNIHYILQYFQKIAIENISINDYQASLFYDGDNFTLNFPQLYAKINLAEEASKILIEIQDFYFKPYGIYYRGNGVYDFKRQEIQMDGTLDVLNKESYHSYVQLNLKIAGNLKTLAIKGASNVFSNINFLRPLLSEIPSKPMKAWIFDNYNVESLRIDDFSLTIPLQSKQILKDSIHSLHIQATAKNAQVFFHSNLPPAHAESIKLLFQNNSLEFYPQSPTYKHYSADGTKVAINNILSNAPSLELNIHTTAPLDANIHTILNAYHISLPISAPNTNITTNLFIHLDLTNHSIQVKGLLKAKDSNLLLNGIPLDFKELNVQLDNHIIKVESKNTAYKTMLQGNPSFIIDTKSKNISGDIFLHSLMLVKPEILHITNHTLPFSIDFKDTKAILLNLPTLSLNAKLNPPYAFNISNLSFLIPFSKTLQDYNIKSGTMMLYTQDFLEYNAKISLNSAQNFLLDKTSNTPLSTLALDLHYGEKGFRLNSDVVSITNTQKEQNITFQGVNLNLSSKNLTSINTKSTEMPLIIRGQNTNLIFKDYTILSDSFTFKLYNGTTQGTLNHKNGKADFYKRGNAITLDAREFGDTFLNTITRKRLFNKGRFFINANTNAKGIIIGEMKLLNTSISELNILQNLMAFIDTIPSLLSFKPPGFNQNGYYLENGSIHFGLNDAFLAIETLNFKGNSMDINGRGIIQLESKNIDFHAELIVAKSLSGIINKIPFVNYILLGKNGAISTNFKIKGNLDNPQIQAQTAQDILLSPFNILKRAITTPFEVFNQGQE